MFQQWAFLPRQSAAAAAADLPEIHFEKRPLRCSLTLVFIRAGGWPLVSSSIAQKRNYRSRSGLAVDVEMLGCWQVKNRLRTSSRIAVLKYDGWYVGF